MAQKRISELPAFEIGSEKIELYAVVEVIGPIRSHNKINLVQLLDNFELWKAKTGNLPGSWDSYSVDEREAVIKSFFNHK